jgi:uncharacterized LabA/DUF88 family protein
MNKRVSFFIDGYNLYHSLARVATETGSNSVKWLDLVGLAQGSLHEVGGGAELASVHYFTALPEHLHLTDAGRLQRHRLYIRALSAASNPRPKVYLGRIRKQSVRIATASGWCDGKVWREKGTDVALAIALMREAALGLANEMIIVSGDSDYLPAVELLTDLHPEIGLRFAFPVGRASKELQEAAPNSFTLTVASYKSHPLPNTIRLPSGKNIHKPAAWEDGAKP